MIRLLLGIFLFWATFRFVGRFAQFLFKSKPSNPEVHSRPKKGRKPLRGKEVIDVDFTEDSQTRSKNE
ncbi:MAG: hypothetical protein HKN21_10700 [Candidatus Eisenbacteria bacterium]|uniref:DUF4834 family protein n=1 Tax=Eiseniibacteriota bacterium TaxID=2212470 RepID=A0A7Y2E8M1_UNCEI|nr:hypothetical protein [Candidatus Eisenbacteria bacterium]